MFIQNHLLKIILIGIVLVFFVQQAQAQETKTIRPTDVYLKVQALQDELELIRIHTKSAKVTEKIVEVTNATPREVFSVATALFEKSNRLSFEITRENFKTYSIPIAGQIEPKNVYDMVEDSLNVILTIKKYLRISQTVKYKTNIGTKTPTDVFNAILDTNRQINLILELGFAPGDVYQQVNKALAYSLRIQEQLLVSSIPLEEELIKTKVPADVYHRLINCFLIIKEIANIKNLEILDLQEITDSQIVPGDVYDMASLVVSELKYLYDSLENPREIYPNIYPGQKTPPDVYQRAGILEKQLMLLRESFSKKDKNV